MEVSKLSFRKETKEQMNKPMSTQARGKLLFARLEELDKDGTLSKAKTRADVARLVGYSEERAKVGYMWVSGLIKRGHITETIRGYSPSGMADNEYHLTNTRPDYDCKRCGRRKAEKKVGQELQRWQDKVAAGYIPQSPEPQVYNEKQVASDTKITTPIKIEITRGDITIKVEMGDNEQASKLITTILKGE